MNADTLVSITGVNFGSGDGDLQEIMIAGVPCTTTKQFVSSTLVLCTTSQPTAVTSGAVTVRTMSGGLSPQTTFFTYRYPPPTVSAINPRVVNSTGGTVITMRGSFFGATNTTVLVATLGGQRCAETKWVSETEITCKAPPGNDTAPELADLPVVVTVGKLTSAPAMVGFRYGVECTPVCDWNRACLPTGKCSSACDPGFAIPPRCTTRLFEITRTGNYTSEEGDRATVSLKMNGLPGTAPPTAIAISLKSMDAEEGAVSEDSIVT